MLQLDIDNDQMIVIASAMIYWEHSGAVLRKIKKRSMFPHNWKYYISIFLKRILTLVFYNM